MAGHQRARLGAHGGPQGPAPAIVAQTRALGAEPLEGLVITRGDHSSRCEARFVCSTHGTGETCVCRCNVEAPFSVQAPARLLCVVIAADTITSPLFGAHPVHASDRDDLPSGGAAGSDQHRVFARQICPMLTTLLLPITPNGCLDCNQPACCYCCTAQQDVQIEVGRCS